MVFWFAIATLILAAVRCYQHFTHGDLLIALLYALGFVCVASWVYREINREVRRKRAAKKMDEPYGPPPSEL